MAQRGVTSSVTRRGAHAPQLSSIFLPAKFWPARIADQSAVRAGGPGCSVNGVEILEDRRQRSLSPRMELPCGGKQGAQVGRGVGLGYFASGAGGCGFESHLVHTVGQ